MVEWMKVDSDWIYQRAHPAAQESVVRYQDTFLTTQDVTEAIREAVGDPNLKVEHHIK